jgi:hypothetical protein
MSTFSEASAQPQGRVRFPSCLGEGLQAQAHQSADAARQYLCWRRFTAGQLGRHCRRAANQAIWQPAGCRIHNLSPGMAKTVQRLGRQKRFALQRVAHLLYSHQRKSVTQQLPPKTCPS